MSAVVQPNGYVPPRRRLVVLEKRERGSPRKLSKEDAAVLAYKASQGASVRELAQEFHISKSAALVYCYRGGVIPQYVRSPFKSVRSTGTI